MRDPLENQFAPSVIILGWIRPTRCDVAVFRSGLPGMLIRLWPGRQCFGHESDLRVRAHAVRQVSIEDPVKDLPIVERLPRGVLRIHTRGTPLERWCAISRAKQIMRPEEN